MCGIASVLHLGGDSAPIDRGLVERMRDRLSHRGPDDAGLWEGALGCIGHRRLSIIDPTPGGHQPMVSADGRYVLAYNGELYNEHDLRTELASEGAIFRTRCDTETLMHALVEWGEGAMARLRGMFAFLFLDTQTGRVTMARDPMGIKPLYYSIVRGGGGQRLVVCSEISAMLEHPGIDRSPDPVTLSAYLSSIRTTLGDRTMYASVKTLEPGDWISLDLRGAGEAEGRSWWDQASQAPTQGIRQTIEESVHRHMRTDVPMCALLSGGIDSAIISRIAVDSHAGLHTYCAGARSEGFDDDFAYARRMSEVLGTTHREVEVSQDDFVVQLPGMISALGYPVSTPNEIAIHAVARALRSEGHKVALSGEGADELFGGYVPIMQQCAAHVAGLADSGDDPDGGLFHLRANAWISEDLKPAVLNPVRLAECDSDEHLRAHYRDAFRSLQSRAATDSPLQAHLMFQRRMNLPNLLQRLDTATMLAGVEGRTPFADIEVAVAAESLPVARKYVEEGGVVRSKVALREAFSERLPAEIVNRPKASFPLPFQQWLHPFRDVLFESVFARQFFTPQAMGLVAADPAKYWNMAWPMLNLTLWGHACVMREPVDAESLVGARA